MKIAPGFLRILGGRADYTTGTTFGIFGKRIYLIEMDACLFR
jgi:hypothetical protein